jgi:tight adherence protein B
MMIVVLVFAGLAGFLMLAAPGGRAVRRRLGSRVTVLVATDAAAGHRRRLRVLVVAALVAAVPVAAGAAAGARGIALIIPAALVGGTVAVLARKSSRRRQAAKQRKAVTQACTMLAEQVRVGQIPLDALRSVAQDCPILAPAVRTADLGGDVVQQWWRQAAEPGQAALADLARAWQLSVGTGASMTNALDDVARALSDDETLDLVIDSEAAGPRASGKTMAVLPFVALGMGYLLGGNPIGFLLGSPFGWACLICGCLFACAGVLWMDRVADHATAGA